MPKNRTFPNREVLIRAFENVNYKINYASEYQARNREDMPGVDNGNFIDIATLLINVGEKTGPDRDSYFHDRMLEIANAFYTMDPNTGRPSTETMKPYLDRMFNSIATTADIDWNDLDQVENFVSTMKAVQALATLCDDFRASALELYTTPERVAQIDAIAGKAYIAWIDAGKAMARAGINIGDYIPPIMNQHMDSVAMDVQQEVQSQIYDATLNGTNTVLLDPSKSELTEKYFLDKEFSVSDQGGDATYESEEYTKDFMRMASVTYYNSSIEQMLVQNVNNTQNSEDFQIEDLILINGVSTAQLKKNIMAERSLDSRSADLEVAKMYRDALTDGKSTVDLMRVAFDKNGKVTFYNQDLRVDLDKLNAANRKHNHGIFRNFLHKIGLWKIPDKFPSNKERDQILTETKGTEAYKNSIKAAEDRFIKAFNSIEPDSNSKNIHRYIPKISRADENAQTRPENTQEFEKEPVDVTNALEIDKILPIEPKKEANDKVLENEAVIKS